MWPALRSTTRIFLCAVCLATLTGCDYLARFSLAESESYSLQARTLDLAPRQIWGLTVADFDGDGDDDILVAGHGGKRGDRIYYYDGRSYSASEFALGSAPDRHGCAAGDVNGDGRLDIYCTAGAVRGQGTNPNELWLAAGEPGHYEQVGAPFGAEDRSGRGRLARFLRANDDGQIDLFATVWGERDDELPNSSARYLNRAGRFTRSEDAWTGNWGGRCLAVLDLDNDGLDELAVCNAEEGAHLLHRVAAYENGDSAAGDSSQLRADPMTLASDWWLAMAALGPVPQREKAPMRASEGGEKGLPRAQGLAALILDRRGGTLQIFSAADLLAAASTKARSRVPLRWLPVWGARYCRPAAIAVADITDDGFDDILITRIDGNEPEGACATAPDVVLFGPDYRSFAKLPKNPFGTRSLAYAANGHFLRMSAGEGWEGGIEIIEALPSLGAPRARD